jgi:hypothetical protein
MRPIHGDVDLGVDDSGDAVIDAIFPPEIAATIRESTAMLGMRPGDLLRMFVGGGLGYETPYGTGLNPWESLEMLQRMGQ